jgi:hypothetical protein
MIGFLPRARTLLAFLGFLTAILACTTLLRAQTSTFSRNDSDTPRGGDPAFLARVNLTIVHSRKQIDSFFEQTSNVVCKENVSQTVVGKSNKPVYQEESVFEYQMQSSSQNGSMRLEETREPRKVAFRDPNRTLLITNGFTNMLMVMHEHYEASYTFEPLAEETVEGRTVLKLHFKPMPGARSPAAIQLLGRSYPLQLRGDIWLDEATGAVVKLISSLDSSMEDLGLRELRSEIHYSLVQFHDPEEAYWMPASAVIEVETPKQHWRNVHLFSEYRRFRAIIQVQTGEKTP